MRPWYRRLGRSATAAGDAPPHLCPFKLDLNAELLPDKYETIVRFTIYDLLWGSSHQGSRHLMPQHESCNIGLSP